MGSSYSGLYSGTIGGSQPYAETYSVVSEALSKDKMDNDIYSRDKGYFKNPTAVKLEAAIEEDKIKFQNRNAHGYMTYVLDKDGNIIFGKRSNPNNPDKRSPHPTLIGGKNPKVQCAGMIMFENGKIVSVDTSSGHFKPNIKSLKKVENVLNNLFIERPELFSKKSKWRKK